MKTMLVGVVMALCAGCASTEKPAATGRGVAAFYGQPRTADLLTVQGTNMTITYTGVTEYKVATILPPLNPLPQDPGLLAKMVDGVVGLGKWGLGWYFGAQIADRAFEQPRTVDPVVVQPEVVTVPSAPAP